MMQLISNIWYSFPVQLILLHLRKYLFMLVPWLILTLMVTGNLLKKLGWHYLFLDPEYFSKVNFISFFIIGVALGAFIFIWNITSYILNSFRFPFLATFEYPFLRFALNNFFFPLIFIIIYIIAIIQFQFYSELKSFLVVLSYQLALISGMILMLAITFFRSLNIHIEKLAERKRKRNSASRKRIIRKWWYEEKKVTGVFSNEIRVDYVLVHPFSVRHVRTVKHYPPGELMKVFRLHHQNALIIEGIALFIILILGFFMEFPFFQIPAAASILLMISILLAPIGALSYWLRSWAVTAFIALLIIANLLVKFDFINHENQAYGFDYSKRVDYNLKNIEAGVTPQSFAKDEAAGIQMLENWKQKVSKYYDPLQKPPLIIINASGGGLKASLWAFRLNQIADSATDNRFYDHVVFVSGASGGMIGEAYYRELYLRKKLGDSINLQNEKYNQNISKDILNAVSFTYVVNDLLFPWETFKVGKLKYKKDRGYIFEKKLNLNTGGIMDKKMGDYTYFEQLAISPMVLYASTIIDDGRRLLISAMPVSYLAAPADIFKSDNPLKVDGVESSVFFKNAGGENLLQTSAIRLNATFPYIVPNVFLPTNPSAQSMDAGMRDNYGAETAMRFVYTFRDWINKNCSRVIVIQARGDYEKNYEPIVSQHQSLIQKMLAPVSSLYSNWSDYHDFTGDEEFSMAKSWLSIDFNLLSFEYKPEKNSDVASMSLHLTTREKQSILSTMENNVNRKKLNTLVTLLSQ